MTADADASSARVVSYNRAQTRRRGTAANRGTSVMRLSRRLFPRSTSFTWIPRCKAGSQPFARCVVWSGVPVSKPDRVQARFPIGLMHAVLTQACFANSRQSRRLAECEQFIQFLRHAHV